MPCVGVYKVDELKPDYDHTYGFDDFIVDSMSRRTAEANAGYLLPHLRPGYRLLDFGCGTGTISVGLADAVKPGELHGVAMMEPRVRAARELAARGGHDNATFHLAQTLPVPFEDGYFDAVHCHNILMSFPEPVIALKELKRVLKPGGVIGCRELLCEASFSFPDDNDILARSWEIFTDLLELNFKHAQVGKELKWLLLQAGFEDAQMSADYDVYSEPEDIEYICDVFLKWFLSNDTMGVAIENGAATPELRDRVRDYYHNEWRNDPAALLAVAHGTAVARVPFG